MSEERTGFTVKKLGFISRWINRYCLSAMDWRYQYSFTAYLLSDDRSPRPGPHYLTYSQLAHRFTIILISTGACGIGIGQVVAELIKV